MEQATTTQQGGQPNPLDSTGLCLLSLDGGGVRGLSTLYILKSIMDQLNHKRKESNLPPMKPCEVFDLIGGTSTGGIIAIMLGRLEMNVDQCIAAYCDFAEAVFGGKLSRIPFNRKGKVKGRFDSAKLKAAIRKVVEQSGKSETDLLDDGAERGCRTFVCTADRHTKEIIRLRSYSLPHAPNIRATICQAALATSAATTFFEPMNIGDRSFADGGLGANNPVDQVEGEASQIWCVGNGDLKPLVKCFISIGTGNPGKKAFEDSMIKFLSETVVDIATETDNTERKFIERWAGHFDKKRYFRFNVEQGLQSVGLDEYRKKGTIEAATEGYITHTDRYFRLRDCIENLRLKQNNTGTSFATLVQEYTLRTIGQQLATHHTPWIVPFERNPRFTGRESQLSSQGQTAARFWLPYVQNVPPMSGQNSDSGGSSLYIPAHMFRKRIEMTKDECFLTDAFQGHYQPPTVPYQQDTLGHVSFTEILVDRIPPIGPQAWICNLSMQMLNLRCAVFDVPRGIYHAVWRFGYICPPFLYAMENSTFLQFWSGVIINENNFISKTTDMAMVHTNFQMSDLLSPLIVDKIDIPVQEYPREPLPNGSYGSMFRWAAKQKIKINEKGKLGFLINKSTDRFGGIFMFYGVDLVQSLF